MYGFCLKKGMGYGVSGSMGYGFKSPAYQLGGSKILWVMGEYGLSELWVMRELTVTPSKCKTELSNIDIVRNANHPRNLGRCTDIPFPLSTSSRLRSIVPAAEILPQLSTSLEIPCHHRPMNLSIPLGSVLLRQGQPEAVQAAPQHAPA